jgi:hypothetical protein
MLLVVVGSVLAHLEKILGQAVAGVVETKGVIDRWDDTVLSTGLTSESKSFFAHSLVEDTTREDIIVALDTHDEGPVVEIVLGVGLVPHG